MKNTNPTSEVRALLNSSTSGRAAPKPIPEGISLNMGVQGEHVQAITSFIRKFCSSLGMSLSGAILDPVWEEDKCAKKEEKKKQEKRQADGSAYLKTNIKIK